MIFVVVREQGPGWDTSLAMREQAHWPDHVSYVNAAEEDGFLVLAGPISGSEGDDPTVPVGADRVYRAMLVVSAPTQAQVTARLDEDPWTISGALRTKTIERWEVLVGELGVADAGELDQD